MENNYCVYEIMNLLGTVEYVGITKQYRVRKWRHFAKPTKHHGKFYGRMDCLIYKVSEFNTKQEALSYEKELHELHGLVTQGEKISKYLRDKFGPSPTKISKKRGRPRKQIFLHTSN